MRTFRVLSVILIIFSALAAFSQPQVSSAGLKPFYSAEFKITPENQNTWQPFSICGNSGKQISFWKLTRYGFMFYADGKFFYEDGFFRNLFSLNDIFGYYYINGIVNGYLDFRMTPFYHNKHYNYYLFLYPYLGYVPYQRIQNINSYIPVHTSFRPLNIITATNISDNSDYNSFHTPLPLKLSGNNLQVNNDIGMRTAQKYKYEKTSYDNENNNPSTFDIRNEFGKKNNNQYYKNNTNNPGKSGSNNSNVSRNNNGSKTGNPGNTNTQKPVKKAD
jgi:hypothetical protein